MTGFEPATPRTPCVCATRLRHIPNKLGTFCRGGRIRTYTLIPLFYWYYPFKFTLFQWFWILLVSTFFYSNRYLKELIFKSSVKVMFPYLSENNLWLKFTSSLLIVFSKTIYLYTEGRGKSTPTHYYESSWKWWNLNIHIFLWKFNSIQVS